MNVRTAWYHRGGYGLRLGVTPANGSGRSIERVNRAEFLPVTGSEYVPVGEVEIAMEVRLIAILPDIVAPANVTAQLVEGDEAAGARSNEEQVPRDRRSGEDSALCVVAPQQLGSLRVGRLSGCKRGKRECQRTRSPADQRRGTHHASYQDTLRHYVTARRGVAKSGFCSCPRQPAPSGMPAGEAERRLAFRTPTSAFHLEAVSAPRSIGTHQSDQPVASPWRSNRRRRFEPARHLCSRMDGEPVLPHDAVSRGVAQCVRCGSPA
jgi:hypothetical protein